jgi:iron complex transport system ATP-binding protein
MITIKDLSYKIRSRTILNQINLQIKENDFWLIFGPNGAGKTTLFRIMNGMIHDYMGEVTVCNQNIKRNSRKDMGKKISYLPQFDEFTLPLSVQDILISGRYPYTSLFKDYTAEDYHLVKNVVEQFELEEFINRDINTLSGGERKKVMLASAFIQDVSIILLDEPFTFLDPYAISQLKKVLTTFNESGKTVVAISHQIDILFPLVNKMAAIKNGELIYSGEKSFKKNIFSETYGIQFNHLMAGNKEIIYLDE